MEQFILDLVAQHPAAAGILSALMIVRIINKPLFALFHAIVDVTKTEIDNEWLKKVEESKPYKALLFVLDWMLSIKVK